MINELFERRIRRGNKGEKEGGRHTGREGGKEEKKGGRENPFYLRNTNKNYFSPGTFLSFWAPSLPLNRGKTALTLTIKITNLEPHTQLHKFPFISLSLL